MEYLIFNNGMQITQRAKMISEHTFHNSDWIKIKPVVQTGLIKIAQAIVF